MRHSAQLLPLKVCYILIEFVLIYHFIHVLYTMCITFRFPLYIGIILVD